MSPIAPTLQAFFTDRLTKQRQVSPRTVASYRDSLKLLLGSPRTAPARPLPAWIGPTSMPTWLPRSSTTSKTTGTTARAPATCG